MSVLFDASSEYVSRTSSLPGFASFTVCGWTKVSNYTADKHMVFRAVPTGATGGATLYFQLQDSGGSTLQIGFWSGSVNSAGAFASRPAPGDWFFWYVRALGTGAGQLQAGWRRAG